VRKSVRNEIIICTIGGILFVWFVGVSTTSTSLIRISLDWTKNVVVLFYLTKTPPLQCITYVQNIAKHVGLLAAVSSPLHPEMTWLVQSRSYASSEEVLPWFQLEGGGWSSLCRGNSTWTTLPSCKRPMCVIVQNA